MINIQFCGSYGRIRSLKGANAHYITASKILDRIEVGIKEETIGRKELKKEISYLNNARKLLNKIINFFNDPNNTYIKKPTLVSEYIKQLELNRDTLSLQEKVDDKLIELRMMKKLTD